MRYAILTATMLATAIAAAASAPDGTVRVKTERAKVEDDDGVGLFLIRRDDYIFAKAGNPQRRVIAYDPVRRRVRINPLGKSGLWIQCGFLEPTRRGCPATKLAIARPPAPAAVTTPATEPTAADRIIEELTGVPAGPASSPTQDAPATKGFRLAKPSATAPSSVVRPRRVTTAAARATGSAGMSAPAALPDCPGDPRCP